jgi:SAM-dependent methyltransferase
MTDFLSANYWENRYQEQSTGWDIGSASAPLIKYFNTIENKNAAILIPGCGNGYEAAYLLANGFTNVTVIDIAPSPVAFMKEKFANQKIEILQVDFFTHTGQYDYIFEQTFFCALDPALRSAYVKKMSTLLKPSGLLVGLLFNKTFETNPPFGGSKAEYEILFSKFLHIQKMELCYNSIKPREGTELFFIASKLTLT